MSLLVKRRTERQIHLCLVLESSPVTPPAGHQRALLLSSLERFWGEGRVSKDGSVLTSFKIYRQHMASKVVELWKCIQLVKIYYFFYIKLIIVGFGKIP